MTRTVGKFGLRPVPHGMRWGMKFGDYVDLTAMPPLPSGDYGHTRQVTRPWGMYLNDQLGDCVVAAKQHGYTCGTPREPVQTACRLSAMPPPSGTTSCSANLPA